MAGIFVSNLKPLSDNMRPTDDVQSVIVPARVSVNRPRWASGVLPAVAPIYAPRELRPSHPEILLLGMTDPDREAEDRDGRTSVTNGTGRFGIAPTTSSNGVDRELPLETHVGSLISTRLTRMPKALCSALGPPIEPARIFPTTIVATRYQLRDLKTQSTLKKLPTLECGASTTVIVRLIRPNSNQEPSPAVSSRERGRPQHKCSESSSRRSGTVTWMTSSLRVLVSKDLLPVPFQKLWVRCVPGLSRPLNRLPLKVQEERFGRTGTV